MDTQKGQKVGVWSRFGVELSRTQMEQPHRRAQRPGGVRSWRARGQSRVQLCSPGLTHGLPWTQRGFALRRRKAQNHHSLTAASGGLHSQNLPTAPTHPHPAPPEPCASWSLKGTVQRVTESCGHLGGSTFIRVALQSHQLCLC